MRRLFFLLLLILTVFLFSGCIQEYRLSEGDSDLAAEYMAGLLIKQDKDYDNSLLTPDEIEAALEEERNNKDTVNPTPTPTSKDDLPNDKEPGQQDKNKDDIDNNDKGNSDKDTAISYNYTLSEIAGLTDFEINYDNYRLYDTYPENYKETYFTLTPNEGYQLLVVSFTVDNLSKIVKNMDLSKAKISYQLDINVGTIYKPLLTLLEDDLQYINMIVEPDYNKTAILVYEVSKTVDMNDINLIISKDDKAQIIKIK